MRGEVALEGGAPAIISGLYENEDFQSLTFVNSVVGWNTFYDNGFRGTGRVIANVEAGLVWGGHDWFKRPAGSLPIIGRTFVGEGALDELDYHATMVGHVLAGTGTVAGGDPSDYYYAGIGMAPRAQIWSGAIATGYSTTDEGAFSTTAESTISVYRAFFQGLPDANQKIVKPDVINSSWGGGDPAAGSPEMLAIDGLARQNATVAFVASAGNASENIPASSPVPAPGSTFNSIAVGSLGGASFLKPSPFSLRGAVDFYNPVTDETLIGVRAAVDIAAPGENFVLAAYLGPTGSLEAINSPDVHNPSPTTWYYLNASGTSFAAPIVAGGVTLLKEANDTLFGPDSVASADDTRVIKSVLMAGATETAGWNNGQSVNTQGVIVTTQALDYAAGAGALNLDNAAAIYLLSGTRDVTGIGGGSISATGWDFATVFRSANEGQPQENDYVFSNPFEAPVELTVSLNWFAGRSFNDESGSGEDLNFVDLNLQVWQVLEGEFQTLLAESASVYNNSEFLRMDLLAGTYGLRITFNGLVYETVSDSTYDESYGLAWSSQAVPEPAALVLMLLSGLFLAARSGRAKILFQRTAGRLRRP